jgi:LuxR family maltose regulon positive regulatory protein
VAAVEPLIRTDVFPRGLAVPPTAQHAVGRAVLVNRLCAAADASVTTIVAPAGYGKTMLLAQWAERDGRDVLEVSFEPADDRPKRVELLLGAVTKEPGRLALVDDVHVLRSPEALEALVVLLDHTAPGTTVALAARRLPPLPLARFRSQGRLIEVGPDELALTDREAAAVLRRAGVLVPREEAAALVQRFEGWPAALFLAALALREGTPAERLGGEDPFLADYLEAEHLAGLSNAQRRFAMRTSVLEELTPDACDSLLERCGSAQMLESLQAAGVVAALDRRRGYRYPRIVRDLLLAELGRTEPERARDLHRVAAARAAENGSTQEALEHAATGGDLERVAALSAQVAVPACGRGRLDTLAPWLTLLHDDHAVEAHPDLCIAASWLHALRGQAEDAQHWADAATRGLDGADPRLRVLQALRCRDGADQMLDDTNRACRALPAGHVWQPAARLAHGVGLLLADDPERAAPGLVEATELAAAAGATELQITGLCIRALLSLAQNAQDDADAFADQAASLAADEPPAESLVALLVEAVGARMAARRGDRLEAAARLERADELLGYATHAVPWLATIALLELVHVRLVLADADGARGHLRQVADIFRVRPRLGVLVQQSADLDRRTRALAEPGGRWASSLTPAERRLLPLLATHLSFREIGERLYVSRNTVKTQAIAVYRKFGVTSRSEAIARAIALGLIDDNALVAHGSFRCAD